MMINPISFAYHRNGVGGRQFVVVRFKYQDDPSVREKILWGILPEHATGEEDQVECYIIDPTDHESCWRGDYFASELRALITKWHESRYAA